MSREKSPQWLAYEKGSDVCHADHKCTPTVYFCTFRADGYPGTIGATALAARDRLTRLLLSSRPAQQLHDLAVARFSRNHHGRPAVDVFHMDVSALIK